MNDTPTNRNPLAAIAQRIAQCTKCELHQTRRKTVPGTGSPSARVMIIGEAPGAVEDEKGEPFTGKSGQKLTQLLKEAGIPRETVFLTNTVKCRPPENRTPKNTWANACQSYLDEQIQALDPDLIIAVGGPALNHFFPDARIMQEHGKVSKHQPTGRFIYPLIHPAAALRNPRMFPLIAEDLARTPELLRIIATPLPADANDTK